jgi:2,5-diketo-D-gluconate reductase B
MTTSEVKGVGVPAIGFGTWLVTGSDATDGVRDALEIGYRQIDTARAYENEREVGRGIAESGVPRDEIFLTTKVPHDEATAAEVDRDADESLERLGVDYLDLLLLHWPNPEVPLEETLTAMSKVREDGRTRQIGVSNFPAGLLRQALDIAPVFCDQVEYHPFLDQSRLLELARADDVLITAYSPLAHGKVPKASSHERRVENFDVFDFTLSDEDREEIDRLPKDIRTANPPWAPEWDA